MLRVFVYLVLSVAFALALNTVELSYCGDDDEEINKNNRNKYNRLIRIDDIDTFNSSYHEYLTRNKSIGLNDTLIAYQSHSIDALLHDMSLDDTRYLYERAFTYLKNQSTLNIDMILHLHQLVSGGNMNTNMNIDTTNKFINQVNHELLVAPGIDIWSKAAWFHYRLNTIRPFDPYNEHMTSLLVNWLLTRHLGIPFPVNLYSNSVTLQKKNLALQYQNSNLLAKLYLEILNWNWNYISRGVEKEEEVGMSIDEFQQGTLTNEYLCDSITATDCCHLPSSQPRVLAITDDIITTIAGTGSTTYSGDNGAATSATLYTPFGISVDTTGEQLCNQVHSLTN